MNRGAQDFLKSTTIFLCLVDQVSSISHPLCELSHHFCNEPPHCGVGLKYDDMIILALGNSCGL